MKNFAILIYSENKIHTNIFPEDYKSSPSAYNPKSKKS